VLASLWELILLLLVLDGVIAVATSAFLGAMLASALDRPLRTGALIGCGLPFLGPLLWSMRVRRSDLRVTRSRDVDIDSRVRWGCAAGFLLLALAYVLAALLPWARLQGGVEASTVSWGVSAVDSVVGALTLCLSAVVILICAVSLLRRAAGAVATSVLMVSALWLAITLNTLIIYTSVDHVVANVKGLSHGRAQVDISAGWGLLLTLGASVSGVVMSIVLGVLVAHARAATPVDPANVNAVPADFGYGDGF
jgi:hypothetical protein